MSQPTETELLILNCIIYSSDFMSNTKYQTRDAYSIYDWAMDFQIDSITNDNKPAEISKQEFQDIINTIKDNKDIYDAMIIKNIDHGSYDTTVSSSNVTNATISYAGDLIVIFKGTASDKEWRDNGVGGYSNITDTIQQNNALRYFDAMYERYGTTGKMYVTGHSKGGNKAQYVTILRGDKITHTVSFDGQGFGLPFIAKYEKEIERYQDKITSICNENDFVNILLQSIAGEIKYIRNNSTFGIRGAELEDILKLLFSPVTFIRDTTGKALMHKFGGWHSPYTMLSRDKEGFLYLDKQVEQSDLMKELEGFLDYCHRYMSEEDWRYISYTMMSLLMKDEDIYGGTYDTAPEGFSDRLMSLLIMYMQKNKQMDIPILFSEAAPKGYSPLLRDFTETTKQEILSIIDTIKSEPWWNPFTWDVWYHIEDAIGSLDLSTDSEELYDYYRKVMDKDAIGKQEIHRIFEEVYALDEGYAESLMILQESSNYIRLGLEKINASFIV